ncbi:MAG: hypothetical protein ABI613_10670, partial [Gemmatimonadota bacterium]
HAARAGLRILGDDLLALSKDGVVAPLPGSLRTGHDSAPPDWIPRRMLSDGRGWYDLEPPAQAARLDALVHLVRGHQTRLTPVLGAHRLASIGGAGLLSLLGEDDGEWQTVLLELAASIPMWQLTVPEGLGALQREWTTVATLLAHACAAPGA